MRKILVLRGGALGDFILTLPALGLLRQRWPQARIELAGNATAAQLARSRGLLDAVHSQHEARWSSLFGREPLEGEFAAWLSGFDLVLSYWPDPDGDLAQRFPLRADQLFLSAAAMPARSPAAAHYCEPLCALGLAPREYFFPLRPLHDVPERSSPAIVMHPGSGSPRKNWPAENWLALLDRLPGKVAFVLGEVELERWLPLLSARQFPSDRILAAPPLEELVALFSRCRLFVGHDSGISHLAAACGAQCVLLFGPTEPEMWAPPTPRVQVLRRTADLASLSIDDVHRAVEAAFSDQM